RPDRLGGRASAAVGGPAAAGFLVAAKRLAGPIGGHDSKVIGLRSVPADNVGARLSLEQQHCARAARRGGEAGATRAPCCRANSSIAPPLPAESRQVSGLPSA